MKAETGGRLTAGPEISSELGYKTKSVGVLAAYFSSICNITPSAVRRNFYTLLTVARLDLHLIKSRGATWIIFLISGNTLLLLVSE